MESPWACRTARCWACDTSVGAETEQWPVIGLRTARLHWAFDLAPELLFIASMNISRQQDRRQHPRTRVSWPIVVRAGASRYLTSSLDVGPFGAKVRMKTKLKTGTSVRLEVVPPEGPPLQVGAMVWRVDPDGLAFLFSSGIRHPLLRTSQPAAAPAQEVAGRE